MYVTYTCWTINVISSDLIRLTNHLLLTKVEKCKK